MDWCEIELPTLVLSMKLMHFFLQNEKKVGNRYKELLHRMKMKKKRLVVIMCKVCMRIVLLTHKGWRDIYFYFWNLIVP
jgi:hypothetical protein